MKQALILFTRIPIPGKTKTRLLGELTDVQCAQAHLAFLQDEVEQCRDSRWDTVVFYGGDGPVSILQQLRWEETRFYPQKGKGIGEKMDRAIRETLRMGYDRCILVGADLPELSRKQISAGFAMLDSRDIALGPTADGGYYLIGSQRPCTEVFDSQSYGGGSVLDNTVRAAEAAGLTVGTLMQLHDIDQPEDLHALAERLTGQPETFCAHTRSFLRELDMEKGMRFELE